ncbi:MAG: glycoside hydrolase family 99-like domain-containing protein [Terrisporobacter sp.]
MKIIAFYLPQFHAIPENDEWWGEGFTEWVNVKKATALFENQYQPRIPLNENYYNLLDDNVKLWQVNLAKENGIYGFCFYHYWFNGHMLLEKPTAQFLNNKELDIPFCLSWANEPWTKAWVSKNDAVLIEQEYGREKEWEEHFDYLIQFFKDPRYIKNNGKPLFVIYRPEQIECLNEMLDFWQELAQKAGLPGIDFAYQHITFDLLEDKDDSRFKYNIEYEPCYALNNYLSSSKKSIMNFMKKIDDILFYLFKRKLSEFYLTNVRKYSYDEIWKSSINHKPENEKCIPGAFVDWDNTPRRGSKGVAYTGANPEKFEKYLIQKIEKAKIEYKSDMMFLFAWNEWAEGGYLEPDDKFKDGYLKAVKNALMKTDEFPNK